jgi:ABC-type amino acid transport substrate-binding protein
VGYGDENTKTRWGKAYSIVLMWSGMFITSLLTGYVLILVTVESGANDFNLLKSKIAVVDGSSGLHFIESMVKSRKIHKYESLDAAVQSVVDGKTDAVIHDKALLDHASGENPTLSVSGDLFNEDYYAFAVPEDSRYLEELNRSMLLNR